MQMLKLMNPTYPPTPTRRSHPYVIRVLMPFCLFPVLMGIAWAVSRSMMGKEGLFLHINGWVGNQWFDQWMVFGTLIGHGLTYVVLIIGALWIRARWAMMLATGFLLSGLLCQVGKRLLWADLLRPRLYFEQQGLDILWVEGIKPYGHHSFPSGHAATAFAMLALMAFMSEVPRNRILLGLMAGWVGFTRVYLAQHFMVDVVAGALLGTACAYFAATVFGQPLPGMPWAEGRFSRQLRWRALPGQAHFNHSTSEDSNASRLGSL